MGPYCVYTQKEQKIKNKTHIILERFAQNLKYYWLKNKMHSKIQK